MVRLAVTAVIGLGVGTWLFGDTYARHAGSRHDAHTIRFAHFGTYQDFELWRDVIAEFESEHPGAAVRQEYVVGMGGRYNTKMRQQILSKTLPDVALVQFGPFHEFANHFADLTDLYDDAADEAADEVTEPTAAFHRTGLTSFRVDGAQRGWPVSGGSLLIYANPECFARASEHHGFTVEIPGNAWTMRDFREVAKLLTCDFDGDGRIDQFGFWLPRWIYYLPFMWSFGADLTDPAGSEWRFTGESAERAMAFYRDLAVGDRVCPRDDEVPQLFQDVGFLTGKVAMCVNGPWFMPFLEKTRLADSYVVLPIPIGPGGRTTRVTWDGIVSAPGLPTVRRETARRFIRFVLSKHVQDRIARSGRAVPALRASGAVFSGKATDARRIRFVEALDYSRLQPRSPHFAAVDRAINRHLQRLVHPQRGLTAAEMLAQLARDPAIQRAFPSVVPR